LWCVLTASTSRAHAGRALFDHVLAEEGISPHELAIDKPSPKFTSFLAKHFGLRNPVPQANNYVVFDAFFDNKKAPRVARGAVSSSLSSSSPSVRRVQSTPSPRVTGHDATPGWSRRVSSTGPVQSAPHTPTRPSHGVASEPRRVSSTGPPSAAVSSSSPARSSHPTLPLLGVYSHGGSSSSSASSSLLGGRGAMAERNPPSMMGASRGDSPKTTARHHHHNLSTPSRANDALSSTTPSRGAPGSSRTTTSPWGSRNTSPYVRDQRASTLVLQ
jgi:hypothetical protein